MVFQSHMMIDEGTEDFQIRWVMVTRQRNGCKLWFTDGLMLDKPNRNQNTIQSNSYTLSRDVGTFNIR